MKTLVQPSLFVAGRTPRARHNSYKAAVAASKTRGEKTRRYLAALEEFGPLSDHAAAKWLDMPLSSVCSIRNGVYDQVEAVGDTTSPWGRSCTLWAVKR